MTEIRTDDWDEFTSRVAEAVKGGARVAVLTDAGGESRYAATVEDDTEAKDGPHLSQA